MKFNPPSQESSYIAVPVDDNHDEVQKPKKNYMNFPKPVVGFLASFSMQRIVLVMLVVGATLTIIHPCSHHKKTMHSKSEPIDLMNAHHNGGMGPHTHDMGPHHHSVVLPPPMVKVSSEDSEDSSDDSDDPMEWIGGMFSWFVGDSSDDSSDHHEQHHMDPPHHHMGPVDPDHLHMVHPPMDPDLYHHMGPHHHTFDPPPMEYHFPKMEVSSINKEKLDSLDDSADSLDSLDSRDKEDSFDSEDSSDDSDDPWEWMGDMWDWLTGDDNDSSDDASDDSEDNVTHWISKAWSWISFDSSDDSGDEFSNSTSED